MDCILVIALTVLSFCGKVTFKLIFKHVTDETWHSWQSVGMGLGLIHFSLAPSFLIIALSFAGFSRAVNESALWSSGLSSALEGGHGREGFALGASPDVNDFWQFWCKSLLIAQLVLCQWIMTATLNVVLDCGWTQNLWRVGCSGSNGAAWGWNLVPLTP